MIVTTDELKDPYALEMTCTVERDGAPIFSLFRSALPHSVRIGPASWRNSLGWWRRARARAAYWLLARLDPLIAQRKLRYLI